MSVSAASTGLALGMLSDMQNTSPTVRPFALKPPSHQNAHVGMVFLALSKMVFACNWGTGDSIQTYRQTLPAYRSDQISLMKAVWIFLGTCLFA